MPTVVDWNRVTSQLVQATLGKITRRMRLISLNFREDKWTVDVYLDEITEDDEEEVRELGYTFGSLLGSEEYVTNSIQTKSSIPWPPSPVRVVYKRRLED